MAETYRFFPDSGGDRLYQATDMTDVLHQLLRRSEGVFLGIDDALVLSNGGLLNVTVGTGVCVKTGHLYTNSAALTLSLDTVTLGSKRIDRIVIRVSNSLRSMVATVIKGTEGASPSPPPIDGSTDILLGKILVDNASGYAYTVTDERSYRYLDADTLDTYRASNATGSIPISNGTKNVDLNADTLDGKHVGTSGNAVPVLDGANTWSGVQTHNSIDAFNGGTSGASAPFTVDSTFLVTNLNADKVDGYDAATFLNASNLSSGTVPIARMSIGIPAVSALSDNVSVTVPDVAVGAYGIVASGNRIYETTFVLPAGGTFYRLIVWVTSLSPYGSGNVGTSVAGGSSFTPNPAGAETMIFCVYKRLT